VTVSERVKWLVERFHCWKNEDDDDEERRRRTTKNDEERRKKMATTASLLAMSRRFSSLLFSSWVDRQLTEDLSESY